MARIIKRFESICVFCGEKSKTETVQGIVACTTCGTEDPDSVPFLSKCDFLRSAHRSRSAAFGVTEGRVECFENVERSVAPDKKPKELTEEEKLKLKILNSRFLSDEDKRGKLLNIQKLMKSLNIQKLMKSLVESEYEQREAEKREDRIRTFETL